MPLQGQNPGQNPVFRCMWWKFDRCPWTKLDWIDRMGSCLNVWSSWKSWRILKTTLRPCQQRPSAWNPKKNQTHGAWESVTITLVGSCWCVYAVHVCETHVQLFEHFEHLVIFGLLHWSHCLLDVPDEIGEKIESSWPEWSKKCRLAGYLSIASI